MGRIRAGTSRRIRGPGRFAVPLGFSAGIFTFRYPSSHNHNIGSPFPNCHLRGQILLTQRIAAIAQLDPRHHMNKLGIICKLSGADESHDKIAMLHLAIQSKPVAKKPTAKKAEQVKVQEPPPPEPVTIKPVEKEKPRDLSAQLDLIRKTCPNLQVIAEIPEPAGPKKVSIVCDQSEFWNKVAGALRDRGVEVEVVDEPSKVSGAHLVLLPRDIEPPFQGIDVIKTETAALYQKDAYLKRILWKTLCEKLGL